jgi:short-subunit dehydrogenase
MQFLILVNNAGLFEPGSVHNEPEGLLESQLAINVSSAYHLTRTLLPKMMERRSGHIFNMCSIASLHAIIMAEHIVSANMLCMGLVKTCGRK